MKPFLLTAIILLNALPSSKGQGLYNVAGWLLTGNIGVGYKPKLRSTGDGYTTVVMDRRPQGPIFYPRTNYAPSVNVDAFRFPKPAVGYSQVASRIYVNSPLNASAAPAPYYLLTPPPPTFPIYPSIKGRRSNSSQEP